MESQARIELSESDREVVGSVFFGHLALDESEQLQLGQHLNSLEIMMTDQERELVREVRRRHDIFYLDAVREGRAEGAVEGEARGKAKGEVQILRRILSRRLGALREDQERILKGITVETAEMLGDFIFSFETLDDLDNWLKERGLSK